MNRPEDSTPTRAPDRPAGEGAAVATGSEDVWTVGRLLTWTTDYLKRRGSESPRLDAEVMLAHVLEWQRVQLYTRFLEEVPDIPRGKFRDLVRRRAEGSPVAYLVGRKEFYSLPFEVSPAVLIPRPESEFVVVDFLEQMKVLESVRAIDVGTGSGCLAIACASKHPGARFIAIDISDKALGVARKNAKRHGVADRVEFRLGDRLGPVLGEGPFDAIVSNPPYIPTPDIDTLEPGVRDYEPRLALDGGTDGLNVVRGIVEQAEGLLKPGGHVILEIGTAQEGPVRELIAAHPALVLAPTIHDHAGHPRVIRATRSA
ncbi:MAG: peptide chain release factor N(5)-glutamine methyltransferase [Isosphaeraceae bacterium]